MFWNDGSFYKGEWRNGIQNGKGQVYSNFNDGGGEIVSGLFENSILVQVLPSIYEYDYEKQVSGLSTEDLFGKQSAKGGRNYFGNGNREHERQNSQGHGLLRKKKGSISIQSTKRKVLHQVRESPERTTAYVKNNLSDRKRSTRTNDHKHDHSHNHNHSHKRSPVRRENHLREEKDASKCSTCVRRLQNFRLRLKNKSFVGHSNVMEDL